MRVQDACAQDVIEQMKGGGDVLVCAPTATGKSLMYMLPSLLDGGIGIVVSPLVALIKDQVATALSSCPPLVLHTPFPTCSAQMSTLLLAGHHYQQALARAARL